MTDSNTRQDLQEAVTRIPVEQAHESLEKHFKPGHLIQNKRTRQALLYFSLAFFIPLVILSLSYALQAIYPLGDRQILTVDLYHQYGPFLREFRSKILAGDSLFYSWTGGLGFNFYGVITYYLFSPYNLLLLLFKDKHLSDAILLITLLKIASSSLTFYYYAYKSRQRHDYFYVGLASAYALSGYSLAYSWNIMWLDAIIILPIVVLGLHRLIRKKSPCLYIVSLCLLMLTNYYMAFFVCIFLAFYFFVLLAKYQRKFKGRSGIKFELRCFLIFAGSSIGAACLSAVTLLPTYLTLLKTSASGDKLPESMEFFEPFLDFVSRLLTLATPSIRSGMANIYIGVFVLLFLPAFFLSKKISSSNKFAHALLLIFLIFSLNNNVLNFIWHGFHYPNQLPYRNSFVLVFLMASMVLEVYNQGHSGLKLNWHKLVFVWFMIFLFLQKVDGDQYKLESLLTSLVLLFIYGMIMQTQQSSNISSKSIAKLLLFVMSIELLISSAITINSIAENEYYGMRDGYKAGDYVASLERRVEQIRSDSPNARAALWPDKSVNDPMLYGYPGLTIFASTYPEEPVHFFANLGYDSNDINSYQNTGSNIVMDSLLGLKYKITAENRQEQVSFYELVDQDEHTALYENQNSLPLLYFISRQASMLSLSSETTSLNNQSSLVKILGGDDGTLRQQALSINLGLGNQISALADNEFSVKKEDGFSDQRSMSYDLKIQESGYYTIAWKASGLSFDQVSFEILDTDSPFFPLENKMGDDEPLEDHNSNKTDNIKSTVQLSRKKSSLADIGYCPAGKTVRITYKITEDSSDYGTIKLEAAEIDQVKLKKLTDQLRAYSVDPSYISANHLTAEIETPENGYILFTTTYDTGWRIKVNDQEVEPLALDKALVLIPVNKGMNRLDLKYVPSGFTIGLAISLLTGLLFVVYFVSKSYLLKNKARKQKASGYDQIKPVTFR